MGQHVTMHGKTNVEFNGQPGRWIPLQTNSAGQQVMAPIAGEFTQLNRTGAGSIAKYAVVTADATITAGPAILYGIYCVSAGTMAGVYDNTAASGPLLIGSSALTAGQTVTFDGIGVLCNTGIYADWTSGSFLLLYVDAV